MTNQLDNDKLPVAVQRVAFALRTTGWVSFWVQLVLGVVAAIILLFAIPFAIPSATATGRSNSAGTGGGVFFAICGLAVLAYSVYRSFRFTRLSRQLRSPANAVRPKKADTIKEVRLALWSNLSGMLLTLIGAEAISGTLLAKSLAQPQALFGAAVDIRPIYSAARAYLWYSPILTPLLPTLSGFSGSLVARSHSQAIENWHGASGIGHRASGIGHRASGIGHRASGIGHRTLSPTGTLSPNRHPESLPTCRRTYSDTF